jgi:predicted Rossmann fold nucleotide-binding protein DprA/Smf involved in DNA uptake
MLQELMQCRMELPKTYSRPQQAAARERNTLARYRNAFGTSEYSAQQIADKLNRSYGGVFLMLYKLEKAGKIYRARTIPPKTHPSRPTIMWKWTESDIL